MMPWVGPVSAAPNGYGHRVDTREGWGGLRNCRPHARYVLCQTKESVLVSQVRQPANMLSCRKAAGAIGIGYGQR